jgi:hypothetical protein
MSGPFATAQELCEWTGMPVPDDLARTQALLDSASAAIRRFTGQTLSEVTSDIVTLEPVTGSRAMASSTMVLRPPHPRGSSGAMGRPSRTTTATPRRPMSSRTSGRSAWK